MTTDPSKISTKAPTIGLVVMASITVPEMEPGFNANAKSTVVVEPT